MIARHWRGYARADRASDYEAHLREATLPALTRIEGFVDASILKRPAGNAVEFLVVTRWRTMEAIRQFAGTDVDAAVVPAEVADMMIDYDRRVAHYEVLEP